MSTGMRVRWVSSYSLTECKQHVIDCPAEFAHTIVFLQMGPSMDLLEFAQSRSTVWILNTEQLSRCTVSEQCPSNVEEVPFPFETALFQYLALPIPVGFMDYSMANINILKMLKPNTKIELVAFIPPKYALKCVSVRKPLDLEFSRFEDTDEKLTEAQLAGARKWLPPATGLVFVGDTSSQYRQHILKQIPDINVLTNVYSAKREREVAHYNVVLNIHFGPTYKIFEELRCLSHVLARRLIVSEDSDFDVHHPLYKFIIWAPYDKLAQTAIDVVAQSTRFSKQRYFNNPAFHNLCSDIRIYEAQKTVN